MQKLNAESQFTAKHVSESAIKKTLFWQLDLLIWSQVTFM